MMTGMADTQVDLRPPDDDVDSPDIGHLVCCYDDEGEVALCGVDVGGEPWRTPTSECVMCVMCVLMSHKGQCPKFERCVDESI
jgi:hypothetical protein